MYEFELVLEVAVRGEEDDICLSGLGEEFVGRSAEKGVVTCPGHTREGGPLPRVPVDDPQCRHWPHLIQPIEIRQSVSGGSIWAVVCVHCPTP